MPIKLELPGKTVNVKVWTDEVEDSAREQLINTASIPWVFSHVCAMPDTHFGIGATVGSVIATKKAISPAAVGVDIGCGMMAIRTSLTSLHLGSDLKDLRHDIERAIPTGFHYHSQEKAAEHPLWREFKDLDSKVQSEESRARVQLGSLGGGNHFIEVCLDTNDRVWIMLHSGSRGIGNKLASIHIDRAKRLAHNADLPDPDLAAFLSGTPEMEAYRRDLYWAQRYAALNRVTMMDILINRFLRRWPGVTFDESVACHHNYVNEEFHFNEEVFVTRKGAISALKGQRGIIPGSMGAKSFIVEGLGNPESFCSASHGAGRKMSRTKARKEISLERFRETTAGVECLKDASVLDEAPDAYKDIDAVMANQSDLVSIVYELKQVLCVKGTK